MAPMTVQHKSRGENAGLKPGCERHWKFSRVLAALNAIPSMFMIRQHALHILWKRDKFPDIMDAIGPGGTGDVFAGLNEEEAAAQG